MIPLTSSSNTHFQRFLSLTTSKGLKKEGLLLLSGESLVLDFINSSSKLKIEAELLPPDGQSIVPRERKEKTYQLSHELFKEIDVLGTKSSILVIEQPSVADWDHKAVEGLTVLAPLGDPGNLGALIRSAKAFGAKGFVLLQEAANPFLPKSIKASAGAALSLKLFKGPTIQNVKSHSSLVVLDMKGIQMPHFKWPKSSLLLVGEEGPGIPSELQKHSLKLAIPQSGIESLNAVVAASLAIYDFGVKSKGQ